MTTVKRFTILLTFLIFSACTSPKTPVLESNAYSLEHQGLSVFVHEKWRSDWPEGGKTLVLLPSATYSAIPNWDLQIEGYSVMDAFVEQGWRVLAVDLPGYGKAENPPRPNSFGAVQQLPWLEIVLEDLEQRCGVLAVDLLGWSWGAQVAGRFAQDFPTRVHKLVLYGFTYAQRIPQQAFSAEAIHQDFRPVTLEGAHSDFIPGCFDPVVADTYARACVNNDADVPFGALHDFIFSLPLVDPGMLTMPCLLISGQYELEAQVAAEEGYFASRRKDLETFCAGLPTKGQAVALISGGGHAVHLENPDGWTQQVMSFLAE